MKSKLTKQFSTKIQPETETALREHCEESGMRINWITDRAILEWLERHGSDQSERVTGRS